MKAMVLKQFGGVENFVVEEIPQPEIGDREVLVQVKAIGIDPIDVKTRKGSGMASRYTGDQPIVLGWNVSGVITEVGKEVKEFAVGDDVFGTVNFPGRGSSYAEYMAAPEDQLAKKPTSISSAEAAAATLSILTAWQALIETRGIHPGDKVLIHGAAGGVGNYAVQIAKHFGAYVVGTASGDDMDFVRKLGADEVIDYKTQHFEELTDGFDLILDSIGGENFVRSLKVLKPDGTIVLLPSDKKAEAEKEAEAHHVKNFRHILMHSDGKEMREIAAMFEEGSLHVNVGKTFSFEQIPEAHTALENGKVRGKIVVTL